MDSIALKCTHGSTDEKKATSRAVRIISYNIAFNNDTDNFPLIGSMLLDQEPDLICLQEVCGNALAVLIRSLVPIYSYQAGSFVQHRHDTVVFGHNKWKWKYGQEPLVENARRTILWAKSSVHGTPLVCTTAHMQSQFFDVACTKTKAMQLLQLAAILRLQGGAQAVAIHAGDTNLTGGDWLERENKALQEAGFLDVWSLITPYFDPLELQTSPTFCEMDATWRSPANPMIVKLQGIGNEHHRPDRFLLSKPSLARINLAKSRMDVIRPDLSDHDAIALSLHIQSKSLSVKQIQLRDLDGRRVLLKLHSAPGGVFTSDVFFGQKARLSLKQTSAQSVLLLNRADWAYISQSNVTHHGAFGDDFHLFTEEEFRRLHVSGADNMSEWVLVWKFPADLNDIPGYTPVYNVPLPVGSYPFQDDGWWCTQKKPEDEALKLDQIVQKRRMDAPDGISVHHLQDFAGNQVAMIASRYFIRELWEVDGHEKRKVVEMLEELRLLQIYAFPCYNQHHAIVFYIDDTTGSRITPNCMSRILSSDNRAPWVKFILLKYSYPDTNIRGWFDVYEKTYQ